MALEIIRRIRSTVPSSFCIGIKLNSADHGASDFEDTMSQIQLIVEAGVDFLEISGGTYEDPTVRTYKPHLLSRTSWLSLSSLSA